MNFGRLALGLVAAAATGAILGLLFAPAKGNVLRRKIRSMSAKEMEDVKEKYSEFVDNVSKTYGKVKNDINNFTQKVSKEGKEKITTAEGN